MAINDISLTAGMRTNLVNLQDTVTLLNRTQGRLATGKKVNTALDNPISFFTAQAHMARASDISALKDGMNESVQTIRAADTGIKGISSLLEAARSVAAAAKQTSGNYLKVTLGAVAAGNVITVGGVAYTATGAAVTAATTEFNIGTDTAATASNLAALINSSVEGTTATDMIATVSGSVITLSLKSSTVALTNALTAVSGGTNFTADTTITSPRNELAKQYNIITAQIDALGNASGYKGTNLLASNDLSVGFEGSTLSVKGFDASASGLGAQVIATKTSGGTSGLAWAVNSDVDTDISKLNTAVAKLKTESSKLSSSLSIINIQQDFSTNMINTLTEGADKLTLADMNEEGANMLMLQTRQSLGTTSLSLASQAAQAVLRLFA